MHLTHEGKIAIGMAPMLYAEATSFLPKSLFLEDFLYGKSDDPIVPSLQHLVHRAQQRWGITEAAEPVEAKVREQVRRHLDGILVGPAIVALARGGILAQLEKGPANIQDLVGKSGKPHPAARPADDARMDRIAMEARCA